MKFEFWREISAASKNFELSCPFVALALWLLGYFCFILQFEIYMAQQQFLKWDSKGPLAKKLKKMLVDGDIDPSMTCKPLMEAHPEFKVFKPDSFRTHFNNIKTTLGVNAKLEFRGVNCPV